nr:sugar/pyridoxal phosphate phosphatase YigL [Plesiomonas shigelloides]
MYRVVASDLDGTLLTPDHRVSPFTADTLRMLTEQGIRFIFATGRHHVDVAKIRENLGIDAYMVTSNGARVHNTAGDLVFKHDLAPEIAHDLMTLAHNHPDIITNVYREDEWHIDREVDWLAEFHDETGFHCNVSNMQLVDCDGVAKVFYLGAHETLLPMEEAINARFGDKVNVSFSLPECLEVMAGGVSKGHALEQVLPLKGLTLADCIAFGDGMNDLEMLSMVGKGCVMQNAHQRLKDALPDAEVIGDNADEAVAHYLRRMFIA